MFRKVDQILLVKVKVIVVRRCLSGKDSFVCL
ncbi:hypothetical protein T4E_7105 [Trichinella pseudospiralis]|uniref:Uncharacterized protein n=1 Tax=Trichinella pseudospiralis TaxID=6337 RepID=A0A0V0XDC0_TRIPS|nr:hypothetical protein T4E_7105 [Trichinella pseudospiralis]